MPFGNNTRHRARRLCHYSVFLMRNSKHNCCGNSGGGSIDLVTHSIMPVIGIESEHKAVLNCRLWTRIGYFWDIPVVSSHMA